MEARTFLGAFGVSGSLPLQPVQTLSGGQMVRVAFALAVYKRPHLLVLDEVSNHLDMVRLYILHFCLLPNTTG